jgi:hypothetical protein
MRPLLARAYLALGLVITAMLIVTAVVLLRHRGAAGADHPTAQPPLGRAPAAPGAAAIAALPCRPRPWRWRAPARPRSRSAWRCR